MADPAALDQEALTPRASRKRVWVKRLGWLLAVVLVTLLAGALFLSSPFGKRFVANQIAEVAPASGLRISVGRIEGDIYAKARLHDVVLSDPQGAFLRIPEVELDWNPLAWLTSGLHVRELIAKRAILERLPELLPGDPDAPILPDFDIRIGTFAIEDMTLASGVLSDDAEQVDLTAQVDIRSGRVFARSDGQIGRNDALEFLIDAEPDGDAFDLAMDVEASDTGILARLVGIEKGFRARLDGDGTWSNWLGHLLVERGDERLAGFRITNQNGVYKLIGQIRPDSSGDTILARILSDAASVSAGGTLEDSAFDGSLRFVSSALMASGEGTVDLAGNAFEDFQVSARLRDPNLFGKALTLDDTRLAATLDGAFADLTAVHNLEIGNLQSGDVRLTAIKQQGDARFDGNVWRFPLAVSSDAVEFGVDALDPLLREGRLTGDLTVSAEGDLSSDNLSARFAQLTADSNLRGNLSEGRYALAGSARSESVAIEALGQASANAKFRFNASVPSGWKLAANFAGRMPEVSNAGLAAIAGEPVTFRGGVTLGSGQPLLLSDLELESQRLILTMSGAVAGDQTSFTGSGSHSEYGPFTVRGAIDQDGPEARLVLEDPLPAAGLSDVELALAPSEAGFAIDATGQSLLGPVAGAFNLVLPPDGPVQLVVDQLTVSQANASGALLSTDAGLTGELDINGGGLDGGLRLSPEGSQQGFVLDLTARDARFAGDTPIRVLDAKLTASGTFGAQGPRINGEMSGRGLSYGTARIARLAAKADWDGQQGSVTASVNGRRGSRFALNVDSNFTPERIATIVRGDLAGRSIAMPRRAVLTAQDQGGWALAPARIDIGEGQLLAEGVMGGPRTSVSLKLLDMPLSLADLAVQDLGFGGTVSGIIDFADRPDALATGKARLRFDDLTRSGLVLSSPPLDFAIVSDLQADRLSLQGLVRDDDVRLGQIEAQVTQLASRGSLFERLQSGKLEGAMRYQGDAAKLWRMAAIDAFDITGPVVLSARATGTLADPIVRGSLNSDDLRVRSGLSGTDVRAVSVDGSFAGSTLRLTRFAGEASNGGTLSGSGTIDLANLSASQGPALDIRVAAERAELVDANGLTATVTGPLRIISDGTGGTIAGRLAIDRASWALGTAADDIRIPSINTREINLRDNEERTSVAASGWRYLIDATARNRVAVDGLGLDSEWSADIALRGTTDDPRIGGNAQIVRGSYTFAGTRFEITRGEIEFDENVAIDPRLDILAEAVQNGLDVNVTVKGNALEPQIAFSSDPALPEEEILSRLLFGDSITTLSATDALQLGAALASLNGGSGLDPINQLRSAIGLDRLRIVSADPALERGTGVALGKNIGRRIYVELVTDGRAYSASTVEFRVTGWLSLLGSVSTIGRDSVVAEVSRDY